MMRSSVFLVVRSGSPLNRREVFATGVAPTISGQACGHKEALLFFFSRSNTPVSSNFVLGCLASALEWILDSGAGLFVVVRGGQMQWDSFTIRTVT